MRYTPMNAVIGMTNLLLDTRLTMEQTEFVDTMRVSGENLLAIINDILDFSKIESGRMELERRPFHLVESIEDVLDLAYVAQQKGIELAVPICGCDTNGGDRRPGAVAPNCW
ncbi:MAG: histidine kinase dimerization/phospho-acceptor domain-containing protein [Caldilineaceae bacterium]